MAEFPDANSGGLDPLGAPAAKCRPPLWRRVRTWTIIVGLYAVFLGMAAGAIPLLRSAFQSGVALDDRLMHLLWAALLLAPLGFVIRYFVRVRLKTGQWRGTPEQRKQERQQRLARCGARAGGSGNACAPNQNTWPKYAVKWATYSAMEPSCSSWQRAAGWFVLATYVLAMLALTAFGVILIGAGIGTMSKGGALIAGIGLAALIWPAVAARSLVRGIRAGKVGATREDLDALRAGRSAWADRERQKPLRSKLINTAVAGGVYALWWFRVTVHHAQHPHESWVTPAMATPFFLYSIWVQFRKPKTPPQPATEN